MSKVRTSVEWRFKDILQHFAFLGFKPAQKLQMSNVGTAYAVATILSNCHKCLYGSQTSKYFEVDPPTLEEYLS
ncbi:hypothetical protein BJV82DRAFT_528300 [Fennellomyces sp. T-0311]|nr:hypothetical protein BJV82DRAFT_528300 [Fennellomyces sp. T-0311]